MKTLTNLRLWLASFILGDLPYMRGYLVTPGDKPHVVFYSSSSDKLTLSEAISKANLVPLQNIEM